MLIYIFQLFGSHLYTLEGILQSANHFHLNGCNFQRGFYWKLSPCLPSYSSIPFSTGFSTWRYNGVSPTARVCTFSTFRKLQFLLQHFQTCLLFCQFDVGFPPLPTHPLKKKRNKKHDQSVNMQELCQIQSDQKSALLTVLMGKTHVTVAKGSLRQMHIWNGSHKNGHRTAHPRLPFSRNSLYLWRSNFRRLHPLTIPENKINKEKQESLSLLASGWYFFPAFSKGPSRVLFMKCINLGIQLTKVDGSFRK